MLPRKNSLSQYGLKKEPPKPAPRAVLPPEWLSALLEIMKPSEDLDTPAIGEKVLQQLIRSVDELRTKEIREHEKKYEMLRSKLNPGGACDAAAGAPSNLPSEPLLGAFL